MKPARTTALRHDLARAFAITGAALLAVVLLGTPALAQAPNVGDVVGGVTGGNSGGSGGGSGSGGGPVGDTVGEVGETVGDTVGEVGGTVGDTVGNTGGTVGDTVGGSVGGAVKDATGAVGGAVKDATGAVGGTVGGTTGELGKTIDSVTDPVTGEGTKGGDKQHGGKKNGGKDGKKDRNGARNRDGSKTRSGDVVFGEGAFGFGTRVPAISLDGMGSTLSGEQVAAFTPEPLDVAALTEAAVEAVKKFAFPILLSILVGCFMLIQDRVDKKDPKLAMAAVDGEQDWLSFA